MRLPSARDVRSAEEGFSLIELLISMAVMLLVLAGTMQMMSTAMETHASAKQVLDMNTQLRAAMDLVQRDLLQAGQGLPDSHQIGIPNGAGIDPIRRPGPAGLGDCPGVTTFPGPTAISAVTTGPGLGPAVNGVCTDVITILAGDNMYGPVPVTAIAADGRSATMAANDPNAQDRLRPGDLLMLRKMSHSVLMQITAVSDSDDGSETTVTFGDDDPLGLNWFTDPDDGPFNTINWFKEEEPRDNDAPTDGPDAGSEADSFTDATRIRMITYYIDTDDPEDPDDPAEPRLVRIIGGGTPNAVGLGAEVLQITYDLVGDNAATNNVPMDASDLDGSGACDPAACSEGQIRKVNVTLSFAALGRDAPAGRNPVQNTLRTQVSLRSMAFVDRYR